MRLRNIGLLPILLLQLYHIRIGSSCTTKIRLTKLHGVINHPSSGEHYSPGTDLCWLIEIDGSVAITFTKLDLEDRFDWIGIYEGTSVPLENKKRFRLTKAHQVANSEFWLTGRGTLVRFKSDETVEKTGFILMYRKIPAYKVPVAGPPAAVELISGALSGVVDSHAEYEAGKGYSHNVLQAWSIVAQPSELIRIKLIAFNTEKNFDFLRIFSGALPDVQNNSMFMSMSGNLGNVTDYNFFSSLTLVFHSDATNNGTGFRIHFDVIKTDYRLHANFVRWNGGLGSSDMGGSDSGFSLIASPADSAMEARCSIRKACPARPEMTALQLSDSTFLSNEMKLKFHLRPRKGAPNLFYCVDAILCHASWKMEAYRNIEQYLILPNPDPDTITINLVSPEVWWQTGLVQFLAVSWKVCPRVRHRCEIRTANGSAIEAKLIRASASPTTQPSCLSSSVKTMFVAALQNSTDGDAATAIACRLNNGNFMVHRLPAMSPTAGQGALHNEQNSWERPVHVVAWVAAAVAILILVGVLLRNARNRRRRQPFTGRRRQEGKQINKPQDRHANSGRNNSYVNTPSAMTQVNEIYVT